MKPHERAIMELSRLIQPSDVVIFTDGSRKMALRRPVNPCDFMRRETDKGGISTPFRYSWWITSWIVSIQAESCQYAVKLYAITAVERGGRVVWRLEDERVPVQRKLFQE